LVDASYDASKGEFAPACTGLPRLKLEPIAVVYMLDQS
jgi:hypothetical protein